MDQGAEENQPGQILDGKEKRNEKGEREIVLKCAAVAPSFCSESDQRLLQAKIRFDHHLEKNTCHRPKGRKQAVFDEDLLNDALSLYDWRVAEDPTEDYELLLKGLRTCADAASLSLSSRNARISSNTKALLEKRRSLRMDPNATHLERLVANTSCRKALQEDLIQHRREKILEAAQERRSLKKCRRDLNEFSIPLSALKREDGTVTTSRFEMESKLD
ncbi:hypothetical protein Q1695_011319 [Nippostrongylus brasiliensis]|nr:hypothetical protein Q1695_011319 [Nippostrongylus brasiliensis]